MTSSSLPPPPPRPVNPPVPPPPPVTSGVGSGWLDPGRPPAVPFPPSARWGLGDAVTTSAIFYTTSVVLLVVAALVSGIDDATSGVWLPVLLIAPPMVQLVHIRWVAHTRGAGLDRDFGLRFRWLDLAAGGAVFIVALVAAGTVVAALQALGIDPPTAAVAEATEEASDGAGLTVWIVLVAVLASTVVPLVEELVFRGLWWSALLKRGVDQRLVLVLTSLVFAVAHLEPARTPILFAIGLALGWGRMVTGRLGASVVAHAAINIMGMVVVLGELV